MKTQGVPDNGNVLRSCREAIDLVDTELLRLLNTRARIVSDVASVKRSCGLPVYDARREQEILDRICAHNTGPLSRTSVTIIFRCIIGESRSLEEEFMQVSQAEIRKPKG